ncbi:NAD(P)-binding protein [Phellopilus nigrolimitatus]|nr:NAD(P)-binding protein [Phellopilus nigrolimitatus]
MILNPQSLVLITGATGYLGAHVVHQALEAGYRVRATARPAKVEILKASYEGKIEVDAIADLATGDYTEALKDVDAIVHTAMPLGLRTDAAGLFEAAVDGAMNILRQGAAAGVKKAVMCSSFSTAIDFSKPNAFGAGNVYTEHSWNPATREEALHEKHSQLWNYAAAKTESEKEIWKFADEHPEIDITTINGGFFYGPLAPGYVMPNDVKELPTAMILYTAVLPKNPSSIKPFVDVRDMARAHILALKDPPTAQVGRKRILVVGPTLGTWRDIILYLREARPELKSRLPRIVDKDEGEAEIKTAKFDMSRAKEVLGLDTLVDWKKTVEDTLDCFLVIEKSWGVDNFPAFDDSWLKDD